MSAIAHAEGCSVEATECDCGLAAFEELRAMTLALPDDPAKAATQVGEMISKATNMATAAAEERWPGFEHLLHELIACETRLHERARVGAA